MHRRHGALSRAFAPAVLVAILAAACTAPAGAGPTAAPTPTTPPTATPTVALTEPPMTEDVTVDVTHDATYGDILTVDGRSVYLFTPDPEGGAGTACLEGCIDKWPAVMVSEGAEPHAGAGLTGTLTTFERPDGGIQVAYAGHPLYYFVNDPAAGDTNGQGVGGVWYLLTPAGEAVGDAAPTTTPQGSDDVPYDY